MNEIRAKGHIMSYFVYFLCGVIFSATFYLKTDGINLNYAIASLFFWMVTCILLLIAGLGKPMGGHIYDTLHIIFYSIFAVTVQIYWNNPFIVYLLYTLQWLVALSFLRKHELHLLVAVQTLCLVFLTYTPDWISGFTSFSHVCLIVTFGGLLLADWIGCNLLNSLYQMNEEKEEHDRSLDDLLDIVEAKHHEAREATKSKSLFLSKMSDEIRYPLNVMMKQNDMILNGTADENIRECSENIRHSGMMISSFVNEILDLSGIEEGRLKLNSEKFSLNEILGEIRSVALHEADEKKLKTAFNFDEALPDRYYGDDLRIRQILTALITNCIKNTSKGTIALNVSGTSDGKTAALVFSVIASGNGVNKNGFSEENELSIMIAKILLKMMDSKLEMKNGDEDRIEFSFILKLKTADVADGNNGKKRRIR